MNDKLSFLLSAEATKIFDHFTALFDIRIAYFTPDGQELAVGLNRSWCAYCRLLRAELGDDALCRESDARGRRRAREKRDVASYRCHGGLLEAVKPLYAGEELIGFIMIGQARNSAAAPSGKLGRWQRGPGDSRLAEAWDLVPALPPGRFERILPLFSALVDLILAKHMIAILGRHPLDAALARLAERPEEDLNLADLARMLGKSVDRTAHLFTETYGKSFKVLQRELRMKKAAELLATRKTEGIKEIAAACGYEDPLYFSRVFRAHFGIPPSKLRDGTG